MNASTLSSAVSGPEPVRASRLLEIRSKAYRRRIWHKVLDKTERAIVSLVIRCVETVRSTKLATIVTAIVEKLTDAMTSRVERLKQTVGRSLAQTLSMIAQGWGYRPAERWARDDSFIQYLTIIDLNNLPVYRRVC